MEKGKLVERTLSIHQLSVPLSVQGRLRLSTVYSRGKLLSQGVGGKTVRRLPGIASLQWQGIGDVAALIADCYEEGRRPTRRPPLQVGAMAWKNAGGGYLFPIQ